MAAAVDSLISDEPLLSESALCDGLRREGSARDSLME